MTAVDEMQTLHDKLLWFQQHQENILVYHYRFLADFCPGEIERWSRTARRARVEMLNNAQHFYTMEQKQRAANQSTIMD